MPPSAPPEIPEQSRQFRGLYRHVKISVNALNIIIIVGIVALAILVVWAVMNGGYTITFDSAGGTDVASLPAQYGDLIQEPDPPHREGYEFNGWYLDEACTIPWDFAHDHVENSMTLYASWQPS